MKNNNTEYRQYELIVKEVLIVKRKGHPYSLLSEKSQIRHFLRATQKQRDVRGGGLTLKTKMGDIP